VDEVLLVADGRLVARGRHHDLLTGAAGAEVAEVYRAVVGRRMDDDPVLATPRTAATGTEGRR